MRDLLLGLLIGITGGFVGVVIYLTTYMKSMEKTLFRLEDEVRNIKVVYDIKVPSSSTSFDKDVPAKDKDYFKPF